MYSKTAKTAHYLPRTGSYSTVPHRNGRVDVLPPGASLETFDDFKEQLQRVISRIEQLKEKRDLLSAELNAEGKRQYAIFQSARSARPASNALWNSRKAVERLTAEKKAVQEELDGLNREMSNLKRVMRLRFEQPLRQERAVQFAHEFVILAKAMLPPDVFERISAKANEACGPAPSRLHLPSHGSSETVTTEHRD